MVQDKSVAEANKTSLLRQFDGHVQQKLDLCKQRQKQQHSIHTSLTTASKCLVFIDPAPPALGWSADQAMQQNTTQLHCILDLLHHSWRLSRPENVCNNAYRRKNS